MRNIILASASPRRCALLKQMGVSFTVEAADVNETIEKTNGDASTWTLELAKRKAKAVIEKKQLMQEIVLAADTMVVCAGQIFNKPISPEDAREKLRFLSGREHEVVTGFFLQDLQTQNEYAEAVRTKVFFRNLSEKEIQAYIDSGEWMDKAGGYGIQGLGALLVEKIEGCYFNVVGLPISSVYKGFQYLGIELLKKKQKGADKILLGSSETDFKRDCI